MAQNFTHFSTLIECENAEQQRTLLADIIGTVHVCEVEKQPTGFDLWVYSNDECDLEELVRIICDHQLVNESEKPWSMEYAVTCSRPRLDEFGGGAVVCYMGEAQWMSTASFVMTTMQKVTSKVKG